MWLGYKDKGSTGSTHWVWCICSVVEWMMCQLIDASMFRTFQGLSFATSRNAWRKKARTVLNPIVDIVIETFCRRSREGIFGAFGIACDVTCVCEIFAVTSLAEHLFQNLPSTKEISVNETKRFKRRCFINIPDGPGCITFPTVCSSAWLNSSEGSVELRCWTF